MRKLVLQSLTVALLLAATWWSTRTAFAWWVSANGGLVSCASPVFEFGTRAPGAIVRNDFTIRNLSRRPVKIKDVRVSCSCSVAEVPKEPIPPGGSVPLRVTVNTKGFWGPLSKDVLVLTDNNQEPIRLIVTGTVEEPWAPMARRLEFSYPRQRLGLAPAVQTFQIQTPEPLPQLELVADTASQPDYLSVAVKRETARGVRVTVQLDAGVCPEDFAHEIVLKPASGDYPAYRFSVVGMGRRNWMPAPSRLFIPEARIGESIQRTLALTWVGDAGQPRATITSVDVAPPEDLAVRAVPSSGTDSSCPVELVLSPGPAHAAGLSKRTLRVHDSHGNLTELPLVYYVGPAAPGR